jgi:molecular chaperone DnaK
MQRALMAVKEAEAILDAVESRSKMDIVRDSALQSLDDAEGLVRDLGNDHDATGLGSLRRDLDAAIASRNVELIHRAEQNIVRLMFDVLSRHQAWWEQMFDTLAAPGQQWSDPERARLLISQGNEARRRGDEEGLRRAVWELWSLQPDKAVDFRNVGIRRS